MLVPHVTSRLFQMICYSQPCVEVFHVRDKPVCIQGQAWPNEAKASENHNVQCVVRSSIDISSSQMISETVIPFHQRLWTGCWVAMCKQWYPAARSVWDVHVPWDFDMGQCLAGNWYDASSKLCKSTIIPYRNGSSDFAWFQELMRASIRSLLRCFARSLTCRLSWQCDLNAKSHNPHILSYSNEPSLGARTCWKQGSTADHIVTCQKWLMHLFAGCGDTRRRDCYGSVTPSPIVYGPRYKGAWLRVIFPRVGASSNSTRCSEPKKRSN